jgi:2-methylcitrate dehydratase
VEDPDWTARYHDPDPARKAFGGRVEIRLNDGQLITEQLEVAHAHSRGLRPFARSGYLEKYRRLTQDVVNTDESERFLETCFELEALAPGDLDRLTVEVPADRLGPPGASQTGIF